MEWAPDTGLWIETDQGRLEARCWGPPPDQAPTLVLLHEGLGCVALWRDVPERLAEATGLGAGAGVSTLETRLALLVTSATT